MVQEQQSYDQAITVYSPEGRMYQVEYAREAVKKGTTTVGLVYKDGVVLIVHRRIHSKLVEEDFVEKLFKVDDNIGCSISGLVADARILTDWARNEAQHHRMSYGERMGVDALVKRICDIKRAYTQYGGVRPFGTSLQVGGVDREGAHLYETDPGGAFREIYAGAMGLGREKAEEVLLEEYTDGMSLDEAINLSLRALLGTLEKGSPPSLEMCTITFNDGFTLIPPKDLDKLVADSGIKAKGGSGGKRKSGGGKGSGKGKKSKSENVKKDKGGKGKKGKSENVKKDKGGKGKKGKK
jgi:proteasome alpha subunit